MRCEHDTPLFRNLYDDGATRILCMQSYCDTHDIDVDALNGYDHCPKCQEQRRVEAMEQEMHARRADPDMHPTVDAPRR